MKKVISVVLSLAMVVGLFFYGPARSANAAANYAEVVDNFGRTINDYGIDLLDWQGYLANPHVKLTVKPLPMPFSRLPSLSMRKELRG